ncbi:MAG: hypothetical protein EXS02_12790 [Planctomycetes bacterium]|nr:hypothetical protein [Planctomycetota bacterium]
MLAFESASNGIIDTKQAVEGAILAASAGHSAADCRLVALHLTMGHDHNAVLQSVRKHCPKARIIGCTCAGVIGREGANESMRALAVMLVFGEAHEVLMTYVEHLDGSNSDLAAAKLARDLVKQSGKPKFVMLLASGIDVDANKAIAGIESVLGDDITIFGGTSADNMKGIASYQFVDDSVHEHAAMLVGFFDPSLEVYTQASHGFTPAAVELTVTKSTSNRVHQIDGEPAWRSFTRHLGQPETAKPSDTIPSGAVGIRLSDADAEEYGDSHILRVITHSEADGTFLMPVTCPAGTKLSLMHRDEARIFRNLDVMMRQILAACGTKKIVAVFHADCGARGRLTLDRVTKEEIVRAMQKPLAVNGKVSAWLGMYGFGEFARLGGRNQFHNYTTSLYVITRA